MRKKMEKDILKQHAIKDIEQCENFVLYTDEHTYLGSDSESVITAIVNITARFLKEPLECGVISKKDVKKVQKEIERQVLEVMNDIKD